MRVFEFFSLEQKLPIPISVMAAQVLEQGHVDIVRYYPVPVPNKAIKAMLYVRVIGANGVYSSNGGSVPLRVAHILYDEALPGPDARLAVAKELLHICDGALAASNTRETVDRLIDELLVPDELLAEMARLQIPTTVDKAGLMKAAACLFPKECRDTLKPLYDRQEITDDYLADLTDLPVNIVRLIMSDLWDSIYDALQDIDESLASFDQPE